MVGFGVRHTALQRSCSGPRAQVRPRSIELATWCNVSFAV